VSIATASEIQATPKNAKEKSTYPIFERKRVEI
jgi:hypothetical protein